MADASGPAVFEHEIRVGWGDCDPARIAYTGRLPVFALEAIDAWWEHVLGGDGWYQLELDRGFGTPFVHLSLDFRENRHDSISPNYLYYRKKPIRPFQLLD